MRKKWKPAAAFLLSVGLVMTAIGAAGCGNKAEQAVVQERESSLENGLETETVKESKEKKETKSETETELSDQEIEELEEEGKLKEKDGDATYEVLETQLTDEGKVISIEKDEKTGETVTVIYDSKDEVGSDTGKVVETKPATGGGNQKPTTGNGNQQGSTEQKPGTTAAAEKPGNTKPAGTNPTKVNQPETKPTKAPTQTTAAPTQAPTSAPTTAPTQPPTAPPTTAAPTQPPTTETPKPSYSAAQAVQALLQGINDTRAKDGLPALTLGYDNGLMATAQAQAQVMATADTGSWSHSHTQPGQPMTCTDEAVGVIFNYEVCYEAFYSNGLFVPYHARGLSKNDIQTCGIGVAIGASGHYYICVQCYAGK